MKLKLIPIENAKGFKTLDVTQPTEGSVVYKNRYWLCLDGDLSKALFFERGDIITPQCNTNKKVADYVLKGKMYQEIGNVQIVFAEITYVPHSCIE